MRVVGYVVQNGIVSLPYGGYKVADELRQKLCESNSGLYAFLSTVEKYILHYIMEEVSARTLLAEFILASRPATPRRTSRRRWTSTNRRPPTTLWRRW